MDPGIPVNGIRLSHDLSIGSTVSFQCDTGYRLSHDETLVCEKNHFWSHSLPTCDGKCTSWVQFGFVQGGSLQKGKFAKMLNSPFKTSCHKEEIFKLIFSEQRFPWLWVFEKLDGWMSWQEVAVFNCSRFTHFFWFSFSGVFFFCITKEPGDLVKYSKYSHYYKSYNRFPEKNALHAVSGKVFSYCAAQAKSWQWFLVMAATYKTAMRVPAPISPIAQFENI